MIEIAAARPRVRVNQVGYLPGRPMRATLVTSGDPVGFTVRDGSGRKLYSGRSRPCPPDPTSGLDVHVR